MSRTRRFLIIIFVFLLIGVVLSYFLEIPSKEFRKNFISKIKIDRSHVNIYEYTKAGMFNEATRNALYRVYVPNSLDNTVSVIDPLAYKVIDTFRTDKNPQHIAPAYNLKKLWVLNTLGNSVLEIDPTTGKPGNKFRVSDPYNLYFTPDGRNAIVVDEALRRFDFLDPSTMKVKFIIPIPCKGVNHMDFSPDGRYAIATCEFSGELLKLDLVNFKIIDSLKLGSNLFNLFPQPSHSMPQDIRITPDGKYFYAADMKRGGVYIIEPVSFREVGFIPTGVGAHSIYPSRDGRFFYIGNRGCDSMTYCPPRGAGSVSVIDPKLNAVVNTWLIPGGGSPDMGNVTPDGRELWLAGRYDSEVYVFDTVQGILTHRIPVGKGPHGLTVWPQPGRFSLGHTGNMR